MFKLFRNSNRKQRDKSKPHNNQNANRFVGGDVTALPAELMADIIIDVGVAGGTPWLYDAFPAAKLVLIEPLNVVPSLHDVIDGRDFQLFECAAGSKNGEVEINYVEDKPTLSSIMDRTDLTKTKHATVKKKVKVRTIDDIIKEVGVIGKTIGIKIDTEGYELEILKGARKTLEMCDFIICEASIEKRFEESYNFSELVTYMHKRGFILSKVLNFNRDGKGRIRMADILFQKAESLS